MFPHKPSGPSDLLTLGIAGADGFIDLGCISDSKDPVGVIEDDPESSSDKEDAQNTEEDNQQTLQDEKDLRDLFLGLMGDDTTQQERQPTALSAAELALEAPDVSAPVDEPFSDIFSKIKPSPSPPSQKSLSSLSWQKYVSPVRVQGENTSPCSNFDGTFHEFFLNNTKSNLCFFFLN